MEMRTRSTTTDGRVVWMQVYHPRVLRQAMKDAGLSIPGLSLRTKEMDPNGKGVSVPLIGFLVSEGKSARTTCSAPTGKLIAEALGRPIESLFAVKTSTVRGSDTAPVSKLAG